MNINKTAINDLKKNNEKISDLLSSLSDFKETELDEILSKIEALKIEKTKPKIKKKESSVDIDRKISKTISLTSILFPKISKKSSIKISPVAPIPTKIAKPKSSQSSENFVRNDSEDIQDEKLKVLRDISSKLDMVPSTKSNQIKSSGGSFFDKIKDSLLGSLGGSGLMAGVGAIKKFGVGKTLGVAYSLKSLYDLVSGIKDGVSDYKKYKDLGDNVRADQVIFKTVIGSFGNIFNIIGGFVPGPFKFLLFGLGEFLTYTSSQVDDVYADKTNYVMQAKQQAAYAKDRLENGDKYNIVQLRPSKDMLWEYKNYQTDSWEPLLSSDGTQLTLQSGKNRIEENGSENGITKYKLKTGQNYADLVLVDGKPKMKVGDNVSEISPRRYGGPVFKNHNYIVGERGPEMYQTNQLKSKKEASIFQNTFSEINDTFKKMIGKINIGVATFFTPTLTVYSQHKEFSSNVTNVLSGRELLDFNNIPKDEGEKFKQFVNQVYAFEGGYSDVKGDIGGKTKYGMTEKTYNAFLPKGSKHVDIQDVSKEDIEKMYYEKFWKGSGADKIEDPRLAFVHFYSYIAAPVTSKKWLKESGGDVEKYLKIKEAHHIEFAKKPNQAQFLNGWLNNNKAMQEMVGRAKNIVTITSNKEITQITPPKVDMPDSNFFMKIVLPQLTQAVVDNQNIN